MAEADTQITAKSEAGAKAIAEIRANALVSVEEIAKVTTAEIVTAFGGKADDKAVVAAVEKELKG